MADFLLADHCTHIHADPVHSVGHESAMGGDFYREARHLVVLGVLYLGHLVGREAISD